MLSNLTEDEQYTIRKKIVHCCIGSYCYLSRSSFLTSHYTPCNEENYKKINKCIDDQKNVPMIIHCMIYKHTNLIKPILQIVIQYIGPLYSHLFELIMNNCEKKINYSLFEPWRMHTKLCSIFKYYNRSRQSWDLPLIDNKCSRIELDTLIRYTVNANINPINDVKMMDFIKGVAEIFPLNYIRALIRK